MARTRKDFYVLALGVASFIIGLVLIGNYLPKNLVGGVAGIILLIVGIYLTGIVIAKPKK